MNQVDLALSIMCKAHSGQKDKTGGPEVLHPIAVGMMGRNEAEMVVGFLHDVVEDSVMTFEMLEINGIRKEYVETLRLLTHDKDKPYMDYVKAIKDSGNAVAIQVKKNDLTNNLERGKKAGLTTIVDKHTKALAFLEA